MPSAQLLLGQGCDGGRAVGRLWSKSHLLPLRPVTGDHAALTGDSTAPSGGGETERAVHVCPAQARKSLLVTKAPGLGRKVLRTTLRVRERPSCRLLKSVFPGTEREGLRDGRRASEDGGQLVTGMSVGQPGIPGTTKRLLMLKAAGQATTQPSALPLELAIGAWRPPPQPVAGPSLRLLSD